MNHESWAKDLLISELRYRTRLSDDTMELIADNFLQYLAERRHQIVPRYLTDDMYDAQLAAGGTDPYPMASRMYMAALDSARSEKPCEPTKDNDDDGDFW